MAKKQNYIWKMTEIFALDDYEKATTILCC